MDRLTPSVLLHHDLKALKPQLVGCVIPNPRGQVLLIHRDTPERVQWELPGGAVEEGESPAAAAQREALEELDVTVDVFEEAGSCAFTENHTEMDYTWFNAAIVSGVPRPREAKHDRVGYFSWDEMRSMKGELSANVQNLLEAAEEHRLKLR